MANPFKTPPKPTSFESYNNMVVWGHNICVFAKFKSHIAGPPRTVSHTAVKSIRLPPRSEPAWNRHRKRILNQPPLFLTTIHPLVIR
jgi:hypothetical protein